MALPTDAKTRKDGPIARGVLDYFPDALFEVANVSRVGNEQHNPGQPMHWAKEKSTDEADCIVRHLMERGTFDTDGLRHSAKVAWRALANLQREIDAEQAKPAAQDERWVPEVARAEVPWPEPRPLPGKYEHALPDLDQEYPPCKCATNYCKAEHLGLEEVYAAGERVQCIRLRAKADKRFDVT